jgi:hypothetical protein
MALTDINTPLGRRIMTGDDCNRPAETDVERIGWLIATTEQNFIDDTTLVDTSAPVAMDAADYRYQYATQIYDDCSQASGKNWFMYPVLEGSGSDWVAGFAYMFGESTEFSSDIRISNDLDDIDSVVTFAPGRATTLTRDPSRVYSGVSIPFDGGTVYQQNSSTVTAFARRDTSAPMINVKTLAKATARASRYLLTINTEEDVIETSIIVPPEQVNDVIPGQRIEAKYVHLPGYSDFSWMRVLARTVTFLTPAEYGIDLTLSAQPAGPTLFPVPGDTVDGFLCTVDGYRVPFCGDTGSGLLTVTIPGTNAATGSSDTIQLYDGCIYRITYTAEHHGTGTGGNGQNNLIGAIGLSEFGVGTSISGPQYTGTRFNFFGIEEAVSGVAPITGVAYNVQTGTDGDPCYQLWAAEGAGYFDRNVIGSIITATATYVSGPDPRFVGLLPCPDPDWTLPS